MNKTANFQLTQWEKTDRIMMEDFNRDNAAIDAALKGNADGVAALQTAMASCGNCRITISNYKGTGTLGEAHPTSLTFAEPPLLVFILGPESGFMARGRAMNAFQSSSNATPTTIWSADQKTVSWYTPYDAQYQLNTKDAVYQVLCFYQA
ncbi:hypothetical protein [uncultured Dysosmobacter sp.]|uniref:hypothetical protein n=1 Tax=uncultured Dysosmobacter sp. TaxID=2591384 RepID=UPI002672B9E2|nr:hypothetical protein [uncultured Dysosmobacter sp.]